MGKVKAVKRIKKGKGLVEFKGADNVQSPDHQEQGEAVNKYPLTFRHAAKITQ